MALQWRKQLIFLSVLELLLAFIQYIHDGKLKTNFLFVEVLLKASNYKLSQGKHTVTMAKLLTLKFELNKMASVATDGANVMMQKNSTFPESSN